MNRPLTPAQERHLQAFRQMSAKQRETDYRRRLSFIRSEHESSPHGPPSYPEWEELSANQQMGELPHDLPDWETLGLHYCPLTC